MFFIENDDYTRHGYYQVDGVKTFSKFEAWQLSGKNFDKIQFIFNDEIMSQYDWTQEPVEDVYDLYTERARQLRQRYDYLVLLYSGGIDSHTMLETFLQNDIHLDEICSFSLRDVQDETAQFNQEVFRRAVPFIQSLDLNKLGTKYRIVDMGKMVIEQYSDDFHFENYHNYTNGILTNWGVTARTHKFKSQIKEHVQLTESGKSVCYIWGYDKPSIIIRNGQYCYRFIDAALDLNAKQYFNHIALEQKFANFYDEPFFITRDYPKIVIKQCHMLVNLMKTMPRNDPRIVSIDDLPITGPFIAHHQYDTEKQFHRFLNKKTVDGAIYPRAIIDLFGDDKTRGSFIFSKRDTWFTKSNHENQHRWYEKVVNMVKENRNFYTYKNNQVVNSKTIASKDYILGPVLPNSII